MVVNEGDLVEPRGRKEIWGNPLKNDGDVYIYT
jgi:hypothetical protein